jgi:tetratricopeptide (TPR) repeat protein
VAGALAAAALTLLGCDVLENYPASLHPAEDFGAVMIRDTSQGRYEEAVQVGLKALRNQPHDAFVYVQIAGVYLIRADRESAQRERWIEAAIGYIDKALAVATGNDAAHRATVLSQAAAAFEVAGGVSTPQRCVAYERAVKLFEEALAILAGVDSVDAGEGRQMSLRPLRQDDQDKLSQVREKIASAGCRQ